MQCSFIVSSLLYGTIGTSIVTGTEFSDFGNWWYTPDVGAVVSGVGRMGSWMDGNGAWNDTLSIWVGCEATDAPFDVLAEVDSVSIV